MDKIEENAWQGVLIAHKNFTEKTSVGVNSAISGRVPVTGQLEEMFDFKILPLTHNDRTRDVQQILVLLESDEIAYGTATATWIHKKRNRVNFLEPRIERATYHTNRIVTKNLFLAIVNQIAAQLDNP